MCIGWRRKTPKLVRHENRLWQQLLSNDNLEQARSWLVAQAKQQDHSDAWDYLRQWETHRPSLIQRLKAQSFGFQAVSEREITDDYGNTSWRELRCAEDRLLIRAIAQVLKPVIAAGNPLFSIGAIWTTG